MHRLPCSVPVSALPASPHDCLPQILYPKEGLLQVPKLSAHAWDSSVEKSFWAPVSEWRWKVT